MGYYTLHSLKTNDRLENEHEERIAEIAGYPDLWDESVKWYDHDTDMLEYSKQYPDVLFTLRGEGDGSGDIWISWYKSGQTQKWAIDIEEPEDPPLAWESL